MTQNHPPPPTYTLLYNIELRQPGCVLLQAAMGATIYGSSLWELFHPETWNLDPTGMKLYVCTEEQLKQIAACSRTEEQIKQIIERSQP